jgi:hypothetical protein
MKRIFAAILALSFLSGCGVLMDAVAYPFVENESLTKDDEEK